MREAPGKEGHPIVQIDRTLERAGRALGLSADRRGLLWLGVCLALLYALGTTWPERADRGGRHLYGWLVTAGFLLLYLRGIQQVRSLAQRGERPLRTLLLGFVVFAALAACISPFHSSDLHAYVNVGHLQVEYGLNPYVHVPADLPGWQEDPMLAGQWAEVPCTYGFLFSEVCAGLAGLGGGDPALTRALFKAFNVVLLALAAALAISTLRRLDRRGEAVPLYLLLWSPYVLLHFVSNGHNDLLMALCLLLAFRLALDGRWFGLVPALVGGALVKHVAAVAIPFALVHLARRHGWRRTLLDCGAGLLLFAFAAWPYLGDWQSFRWSEILERLTTSWNSFQGSLLTIHGWLVRAVPALEGSAGGFAAGLRVLFGGAFLLWYVGRLRRAVRTRSYGPSALVEDGLVSLFVLLVVASSAWHPWYLGMFLPAVFLLPEAHRVRRLTLSLAAFQMLLFTPMAKARVLPALLTLGLPLWLEWRRSRRAAA